MGTPVIVGAARTAIGRSFKGTLVNTPPETLITTVLPEVVRRSGVDPAAFDDIIFAESHYGGGDLARYAATATGMESVPGQSVNRHCAGSLTAIGNAAAQIGSGMERALVAGGVQSLSMTPLTNWRIPGPELKFEERWMPPTHVETPDAPCQGHVDHGRLEHRAGGRHHPRGDGRVGGAIASARDRRDRRGQVPRRDHPAEGAAVRRHPSSTSASTSTRVATPPSRSWPG